MKTKSVLYAAVGAPVVAARKVSDQYDALKTKVDEERSSYAELAQKTIDSWAVEGEKVVTNVQDRKVVEEISSKVDLDQAKEQVTRLRDQLEDMLATWRQSFRPEKTESEEVVVEVSADEAVPAADGATAEPVGDDVVEDTAIEEEPVEVS